MADRLKGKTALVTGAGQGIGFAIALRLAEEGASIAVNDISPIRASAACDKIRENGGTAEPAPANIADSESVARMVGQATEYFGHLDILVNNAGIIRDNFLQNLPETDWDAVLNVNLKGVYLCCRAVIQEMLARRAGRIINISSRAYMGNRGQVNYSASKAGVVGLTRALALEVGRFGIRVNAVAPGLIDTPLVAGLREDVRQKLIMAQPTRTMGQPKDIANAVLFLASEEAEFITGEVLHVDGGKSIGGRTS